MRRLIAQADVVIANFSPGALKHFGLDYETLSRHQGRHHPDHRLGLRLRRPAARADRLRRRRPGGQRRDLAERRARPALPLRHGLRRFRHRAVLRLRHAGARSSRKMRTGKGAHGRGVAGRHGDGDHEPDPDRAGDRLQRSASRPAIAARFRARPTCSRPRTAGSSCRSSAEDVRALAKLVGRPDLLEDPALCHRHPARPATARS